MNIAKGIKAAAKAFSQPETAKSFRAAGKIVECPHCENVLFHKKKASLNRATSSLTNTEWLDHEASALVCANCSQIVWFYNDLKEENAQPEVK